MECTKNSFGVFLLHYIYSCDRSIMNHNHQDSISFVTSYISQFISISNLFSFFTTCCIIIELLKQLHFYFFCDAFTCRFLDIIPNFYLLSCFSASYFLSILPWGFAKLSILLITFATLSPNLFSLILVSYTPSSAVSFIFDTIIYDKKNTSPTSPSA